MTDPNVIVQVAQAEGYLGAILEEPGMSRSEVVQALDLAEEHLANVRAYLEGSEGKSDEDTTCWRCGHTIYPETDPVALTAGKGFRHWNCEGYRRS